MDIEKQKLIYNFIKNELISEPFPIFVDISRKVYEVFGVKLPANQISKMCAQICKENNLNKSVPLHPMSVEKRRLYKDCIIADASGITDEEIYLSKLKGYAYSTMSRVYFESTGKLLSVKYFSDKYKRYCSQHNIQPQKKLINPQEFLAEIKELEEKHTQHSDFYKKLMEEEHGYSREKRLKALSELHDPIKKLKHDNDDHDER